MKRREEEKNAGMKGEINAAVRATSFSVLLSPENRLKNINIAIIILLQRQAEEMTKILCEADA